MIELPVLKIYVMNFRPNPYSLDLLVAWQLQLFRMDAFMMVCLLFYGVKLVTSINVS